MHELFLLRVKRALSFCRERTGKLKNSVYRDNHIVADGYLVRFEQACPFMLNLQIFFR